MRAATEIAIGLLNEMYPGQWMNLQFEHMDEAGYWYSFELARSGRRQTICVRHSEVGNQMYTEYRNGEPAGYMFGPSWKAQELLMEGGYATPEEALAAWQREEAEYEGEDSF